MVTFAHIAPDGSPHPFSDADNQIIADAKARGVPTARINDVVLPTGAVLQFEVRFGAAARSEKMPQLSETGMCQVNIANDNTRIVQELPPGPGTATVVPSQPGPTVPGGVLPAPPTRKRFVHIAPDGSPHPFSDADNQIIADAKARGVPTARINDVVLPTGAVLQFEVRFGAAARSEKMPQLSETGMCQVNIANDNTRIVQELPPGPGTAAAAHALSALPPRGYGQSLTHVQPPQHGHTSAQLAEPEPVAAPYYPPPPNTPPVADPPVGGPAYGHLAPDGSCTPFSEADNRIIAAAERQGNGTVRISDVVLPNGAVLQFEVRFGAAAVSSKMKKPPASGMIQVNLSNQNTRVVRQIGPPTSASPAWTPVPPPRPLGASAARSVAATPSPDLKLQKEEEAKTRDTMDILRGGTKMLLCKLTGENKHDRFFWIEEHPQNGAQICWSANPKGESSGGGMFSRQVRTKKEALRSVTSFVSVVSESQKQCAFQMGTDTTLLVVVAPDQTTKETWVFGCQLVLKEEEAVRDKLERDRLAAQKASAAAAKQAADRMESKARREMKKAKADADEAIADALAEAQKLVEVQQAMKAEADESRQALEQISSLTSLSPALALCEEHGVTPLLPQLSGALSQLDQVIIWGCEEHQGRVGMVADIGESDVTVNLQPDSGPGRLGVDGGDMIQFPLEQVLLARHEPILLDAVKKALRNHFMARYIGPAAGGGLLLAEPKTCVVCGQVFRHLNDGVECTSDHFTCNMCLCQETSEATGLFESLEIRRQSAGGGAEGKWIVEPEDLGSGVLKYSLTHAGVGVSHSLDAHHFGLAFTQYGALLQGSAKKVTRVDYYHNPGLLAKFEATRHKFARSGKDDAAVWIFHGSKRENIPKIMGGGFKVGGKVYDGETFPVANGTAYGQGVYSATGPNTPMSYSRGGNTSIILAMALKGHFAHTQAEGLDSWSNGSSGSDWLIFADDEQVLPVYVVHYDSSS